MELIDLEIIKVEIPLPFRLNHINCYLAKGKLGWTIIDSGLGYYLTRETWIKTYKENGLKPSDIKTIYLTHYHPDHYGFLGELQQWTGAEVWMSRQSYEQAQLMWSEDQFKKLISNFYKCGIPEEMIQIMGQKFRQFFNWVRPHATVDHYIEEGQNFKFGVLTYEALHTPGHADGHMSFFNNDRKVLIAGDQILQKITPNISYLFIGNDNPLQDYFDSLYKLLQMEVDYVIPGHGLPFSNGNARIKEMIHHHDERIERTLRILETVTTGSSKGMTIYEVCKLLFNKQLSEHEMRFAIGETFAHLQFLFYKDKIIKEIIKEKYIFSIKK